MVLGVEKSITVLSKNRSLDAYLIYSGEDGELSTYITEGIVDKLEILDVQD